MDLKKVDRLAWRPAGWVGALGSIFFRFRGRAERSDTLIIRPGGMGDLILLTLAAEEMGVDPRKWDWLIEKRSEPWARQLGLNYFCYDRDPLGVHLKIAGRYRNVVNTEQYFGLSQASALLARAGAGRVSGFSTNLASSSSDPVISYDPLEAHECVEFSRLLAKGVGDLIPLKQRPVRKRARAVAAGKIVALAGLQATSRALTLDQWEDLSRHWAGGESLKIVAAPVDEEFARELAKRRGTQTHVVIGHDFGAVCDLLAEASEVLTIDGGLLHVASYFGVPVTAVFTSSREKKWAPLGSGSRFVRTSGLSCQPCALYAQVPPCEYRYACKAVEYRRDLTPA